MVEPDQTSIPRQQLGNDVSAATNMNKDQFPLQRIAANESLPGRKSLNKVTPVTTQNDRGTVRRGDFDSGRLEVIKTSAFVNSRIVEISRRLARFSS
jgi:hypothetical protein